MYSCICKKERMLLMWQKSTPAGNYKIFIPSRPDRKNSFFVCSRLNKQLHCMNRHWHCLFSASIVKHRSFQLLMILQVLTCHWIVPDMTLSQDIFSFDPRQGFPSGFPGIQFFSFHASRTLKPLKDWQLNTETFVQVPWN